MQWYLGRTPAVEVAGAVGAHAGVLQRVAHISPPDGREGPVSLELDTTTVDAIKIPPFGFKPRSI